jgi:methyl-accepting chemotaxis protein
MRSEEEAKLARQQLTATQSDIIAAVGAVQRVDGALAGINDGVREVHEMLAQIASDNQAQSAAIGQVSSAVGTMDQSTQQNAAMVEETSAAARALSSEVDALAERARGFNVGERTVRAAARPAALPRNADPLPRAVPAFVPATIAQVSDSDWTSF